METQVKEVIAVESAQSQSPSVSVLAIFDSAGGKGKNVQLRWNTKKEGTTGMVSFFLGKLATPNIEKRTALQFIENDVLAALNLKEEDDFNAKLKEAGQAPVRLSISEISNDHYQSATENAQFGYQQKVNPSTGEVMGYENAPIWRKTFVDTVDGFDEYLQSDGSTVTIQEGEVTV